MAKATQPKKKTTPMKKPVAGFLKNTTKTVTDSAEYVGTKAKEVISAVMPSGADKEFMTLNKLFENELADLYSAENQILEALPKMAEKASNKELKAGFQKHFKQTQGHIKRLETIAKKLKLDLSGKTCQATKGLVKEGQEVIDGKGAPELIDAALIGAAQRIEHYEMAGYGGARAMAQSLGYTAEAKLLQDTLDEEGATDKALTTIAEAKVLPKAMMIKAEA